MINKIVFTSPVAVVEFSGEKIKPRPSSKPFEHIQIYYMEKPIQQKQKAGIVTPLNDTTLTKVTYGKYATRVPDEVAYGIYEWFSSQ